MSKNRKYSSSYNNKNPIPIFSCLPLCKKMYLNQSLGGFFGNMLKKQTFLFNFKSNGLIHSYFWHVMGAWLVYLWDWLEAWNTAG